MEYACCGNCNYSRYLPDDDALICLLSVTDVIEYEDFCSEYKEKKQECCGKCKYHRQEEIDGGWVCVNPDSDYCTDLTDFNDCCDYFTER